MTDLFLIGSISTGAIQTSSIQSHDNSIDNSLEQDQIKTQATKAWTFMVYLDADCNLEGAGIEDINEMEIAGSDTNINIVVQIDRSPEGDTSNGDWTDTRRYYITRDTDTSSISSTMIQNIGEINMGAQASLENFVQWAKTNYPASRYALVLWDHGSGITSGQDIGGVCWDDTDGGDYLTISEVSSTLASNPINLLCFDACLMGATEVHYQMRNYVEAVVGSEAIEPGAGYPYNTILNWLKNNPTANATELGEQIVKKYNDYYSGGSESVTQAVANAWTIEINGTLQYFTALLGSSLSTQYDEIKAARAATKEFDFPYFIDLYDFADNVRSLCTGDVATYAQYLMDNISKIVVEEAHSSDQNGAHGLSIYFPESFTVYTYDYRNSFFADDLLWDEFLEYFLTNSTNGEYDDEFENNDDHDQAATITQGEYFNLICNDTDEDYYNISLQAGNFIEVYLLFDNDTGDLTLVFYDPDQAVSNFSMENGDVEYISYVADVSGIYTIGLGQGPTIYQEYQTYTMLIYVDIDDAFEENDQFSTASAIDNNTLYTNLVCVDADFYKFNATDGYLINVTIGFSFAEGDLDLALANNNGDLLDTSETATDYENVQYCANYTGYFYILVVNNEDNFDYWLTANVTDIDDDCEPNNYLYLAYELSGYGTLYNRVCINNDVYNITLTAPMWINITIYFSNDEGDLDLYLLNPQHEAVAVSFSTNDYEIIYYNVTVSGEYAIVVNNYENNLNYTLAVHPTTTVWDDIFEENDDYENPHPLTIGQSYTNLTAIDWDFYSINVQADFIITITLDFNNSEGDLDLYLYDINGNTLDVSGGTENQEQIVYTITATATYIIFVYNYQNNMEYNITISQIEAPSNGDDDDDDNKGNKKSGAVSISSYMIVPLIAILSISVIVFLKRYQKKTYSL